MKTTKFFFMAALALMTAACSNDDNELTTQQPQKAKGIPFTATITVDNGAKTRALAEDGTTIVATWADGEEVALIYDAGGTPTKTEATVTKQLDGSATISATLAAEATDDSDVTIIYPASAADGTTGNVLADLLFAQDGTLTGTSGTSIAEKYDVRKGNGKLSISGGKATVNNGTAGTPVSLTNQFAIFKLTLRSIDDNADVSATSVKIYDQTNTLLTTVTPASGFDKVMYVALPTSATTLKFAVTDGTTNYFNMASGLSLGTNYYKSTIKLATVGDVIMSTGKCAKAGTWGAVAMIAYLGNGSDCTNGLAIQLNSSPESKTWSEAGTYAAGLTAVPGGTWRLPSKADWQNMFLGCAKSGDASSASDFMKPINGFKSKIAATVTTWQSLSYWSSTGSGSNAWDVFFDLSGSYARAFFDEADDTSRSFLVLGCLAF